MDTISHREMRNRSGEILRRIAAGETLRVTNNGQPAALIVPIGADSLDDLVARGEARPARAGIASLASIERKVADRTSSEIIDDSRGRW